MTWRSVRVVKQFWCSYAPKGPSNRLVFLGLNLEARTREKWGISVHFLNHLNAELNPICKSQLAELFCGVFKFCTCFSKNICVYKQIWNRTLFMIDSVLRHCADNKKRGLLMLPNACHQILCLCVARQPPRPQWAMASSFMRFLDHTQRRTTVGRTPLDEWSTRRRDHYVTTHNNHNRQTSMPPVGFDPTISADERPQTYALDSAATGTGQSPNSTH